MEWISKYDLYENIYGKGIESKRGLNVTKFLILDESIIFIAAEKDSYFFDTKEDNAILFISKDLGNEYKEIIFPEKSINNEVLIPYFFKIFELNWNVPP